VVDSELNLVAQIGEGTLIIEGAHGSNGHQGATLPVR